MIDNAIGAEVLDAPVPDNADVLSSTLARQITDGVVAQLPEEKRQAEKELLQTANELAQRGSDYADGRGQAIGSIPPRVYMRWQLMLPGCWQDKQFVDEFLTDNPQCRAPGYRPKAHGARHGFSVGADFYQKNKDKVV